ncbi:MAG TPA: DNA-processing protein DprA [Puia sp.]|nr:DNA-processing protein DprA [Puia sp.]
MKDQALYQLALARIDGIGPVYTKKLIEQFGDAASVFRADRSALEHAGLPRNVVTAILEFTDYPNLQMELLHLRNIRARILFFTDPDYPHRLLHLPNAPALLFYQGTVSLNAHKVIAVVGTRVPSEYGKEMAARLVRELARPDLLILSGLALGVDAIAHRNALKYHLPTVGVLGHGLDHLYPAEHRSLSHAMRGHGGLLTSFFPETGPGSHTFPARNQLLAGLCDGLVVIESGTDGGSLSAANAAWQYGKKVFAVPGRITDKKSQGCLELIHKGEAIPMLSAEQLKAAMGWHWAANHDSHQPALPFSSAKPAETATPTSHIDPAATTETANSTPPTDSTNPANPPKPVASQDHPPRPGINGTLEAKLINLLAAQQPRTLNDFITLTRQPVPTISVTLLNLELRGIIRSLPGKRYLLVS